MALCAFAWSTSTAEAATAGRLNPEAMTGASNMPGTVSLAADIDGDKRTDFVSAHISGNGYRIVIALSSRSELAVLRPPVQLGVVTVHVCDMNNDRISDILVRSPATSHAIAVWLGRGDGRFEPVDSGLFREDAGFAASTAYQSSRLQYDGEFSSIPSNPACGNMNEVCSPAEPDPNGSVSEYLSRPVPSNPLFRSVPRSPPAIPVL